MYACESVCHGEGLFCEFALKISYTDSAIIHVAAANTGDLSRKKCQESRGLDSEATRWLLQMDKRWTGTFAIGLASKMLYRRPEISHFRAQRGLFSNIGQLNCPAAPAIMTIFTHNLPATSVWCHIRKCFFVSFLKPPRFTALCSRWTSRLCAEGFAEPKSTLKWTHSVTQTAWPHDTPQSCTPGFLYIYLYVYFFLRIAHFLWIFVIH